MTEQSLALPNSALPAITIGEAVARYNAVVEFTKTVMKRDKDFGVIPGTGTKPTLYKPGAEKLCTLFGLHPTFTSISQITDWEKGFFYFQYRCDLVKGGEILASGIGSCNSKEVKYRYRQSQRVCPTCGKPSIIKGKEEYGGGWLCFAKKGGCGAKFRAGDKSIEGQITGQVENTEPFDLVNTIDKMAQKRAFVAATLIGANASEFFTQDIEDMGYVVEGESRDVPPGDMPDFDVPSATTTPVKSQAPASKPTTPASAETTATETTATKVMPAAAMWKKYVDLETEAHALGLETISLSIDTGAEELAKAGKVLRDRVNVAKVNQTRAQIEHVQDETGEGDIDPRSGEPFGDK